MLRRPEGRVKAIRILGETLRLGNVHRGIVGREHQLSPRARRITCPRSYLANKIHPVIALIPQVRQRVQAQEHINLPGAVYFAAVDDPAPNLDDRLGVLAQQEWYHDHIIIHCRRDVLIAPGDHVRARGCV